jgi:eukaryotic-like serine/threonine-protein kinase
VRTAATLEAPPFRVVTTDLREQLQNSLGDAYAIERELGGGGMSIVFLAEERSLGRRVVVKVLPQDLAGNVSIARFRREISLSARLQHPHIVPVLAAGEIDGQPYYIMPFVAGESLRSRLSHGELPIAETVSILRDVAKALEYAHANGIAHRDIKPDNVLLVGRSAVIADFGVAKALGEAVVGGALTSVGIALGTAAYMAPEQAAADPATDFRADLYAFGVTAYEMLAGHPPFAGRNTQATLAAHATETPPAISRLRSATPPRLALLVMQCLEKRPGDRPQSAAAIVHALDDVDLPARPAPPPDGRPVPAAGKRGWIAAVVVAGLIAATVLAWSRAHSAPRSAVRSIAILPFEDASGDSALNYLGDGISDELRSGLTIAFPELSIKARSSSERFRGSHVDVRDAGAKLVVGMILEGTVRAIGTRLHVTADLVNVADERSLWNGVVDVPANDLAAAQDSILRAVSSAFAARLSVSGSSDRAAPRARGTNDEQAYELFLRGRYAFDRFDFPRAAALFQAAVARDPRFARAHAFLAMTYSNGPLLGVGSRDSADALARASIDRALALDPRVVEAYLAQSNVLANEMRVAESVKPLAIAFSIDSTDPNVLGTYGFGLGQMGRVHDGLALARRGADRDPLSVTAVGIFAYLLASSGQYAEAIRQANKVLELDPTSVLTLQELGFLYALTGHPDSSVAAFQRAFQSDSMFFGRSTLVFGYAAAGRWKDADRERALVDRDRNGNSPHYQQMIVHLAYGEYADAMTSLERGVATFEPRYSSSSIACDPIYDPLKSNPRFASLMLRIGAVACPASASWPVVTRRR